MQSLPVVFCIDRAGFVGADGPTHHGLMDIGFLRMMPNMILTAPANKAEMERELILKSLESQGGNRTATAGILDISVRTLRKKLAQYGKMDAFK